MLGQDFVSSSMHHTPAKTPSVSLGLTYGSLHGSNKVLASKQGQVASFDQDTHVGELFKTSKGLIFSWW